MLFSLLIQVALASPCVDQCVVAYESCAALSAAGCSVAGSATEKLAGRALGNVPGGALLSRGIGAQAQSVCEEKLAPCRATQHACIEQCPADGSTIPQIMEMPSPLLIFGSVPKAGIWIDGKRAGTMPASANEPYTSPPLLPGTHTVRVATADGASWEGEVEVVSGEINSLEVGPIETDDERRFAAALVLEAGGELGAAQAELNELAASRASDDIRAKAAAASHRIEALLAAAALQADQDREEAAAYAWGTVLLYGKDPPVQLAAAEAWLVKHEGTAHTADAHARIAEIDQLIESTLGPALHSLINYEANGQHSHAARVLVSQTVLKLQPAAQKHGLERYLEAQVVKAGVWVPPDARSTRRKLWRAEQRRSHTGRGTLVATSICAAAALPIFNIAPDSLYGVGVATVGLGAAAGAGIVATTEIRHRKLEQVYGPGDPNADRMPSALFPLLTLGAVQLTFFQSIRDDVSTKEDYDACEYSPNCGSVQEQIEADQAADRAHARMANLNAAGGWINIALGAAALGIHFAGRPIQGAHLSATGLTWSF